MFPSLIDLPVYLIKCQVRTGTANPIGALKLLMSYHCITYNLSNAFKNIRNMHVRERHENAQREMTFYHYALEYMAT